MVNIIDRDFWGNRCPVWNLRQRNLFPQGALLGGKDVVCILAEGLVHDGVCGAIQMMILQSGVLLCLDVLGVTENAGSDITVGIKRYRVEIIS